MTAPRALTDHELANLKKAGEDTKRVMREGRAGPHNLQLLLGAYDRLLEHIEATKANGATE